MKKFLVISVAIFSLLTFYGCAAVLISAGIVGGVAISEDTAKLEADTSYNRAWKIAYNVIKGMGAINFQDKESGKIVANVQDSKIEAKVIPLTPKTVRIEIKARKNMLPNMDLAMIVINRINSKF